MLVILGAGFLAGAGLAALVARFAMKRSRTKVRAAERRAQAAERLAEVGSMTAGLAHEIKNPLSTIGLNAQLLAEGIDEFPSTDDEVKGRLLRRLASLRREVERLRGILTDFLAYAGEMRLERKPVDLRGVIDDLCDFFMPQARQLGIMLRCDLPPTAVTADVDAGQLKQAVLNLLLNASQAMAGSASASTEIILRVEAGHDPENHPVAVVHVIDTGPGIEPAVRARLFHPYFTTKNTGTGLGLATTRRIVEAHGGRVDVVTEVGKGSDFRIILPTSTG